MLNILLTISKATIVQFIKQNLTLLFIIGGVVVVIMIGLIIVMVVRSLGEEEEEEEEVDSKANARAEAKAAKIKAKAEAKIAKAEAKTEAKAAKAKAKAEAKSAKAKAKIKPVVEAEAEPEMELVSEPVIETDPEFEAEVEGEPEFEVEAEAEVQPEPVIEAEPEFESESVIETEMEAEPEFEAEVSPVVEAEPESKVTAKAEAKAAKIKAKEDAKAAKAEAKAAKARSKAEAKAAKAKGKSKKKPAKDKYNISDNSDYRLITSRILHVDSGGTSVLLAATGLECLPVTIPVNVAISLVKRGKKCLLVDFDVKRDAVARVFDIANNGKKSGKLKPQKTDFKYLQVWPARYFTHESTNLGALIESYRKKYDYILLNAPYLDSIANNTEILAAAACGFIFTDDIKKTTRLAGLMKASGCKLIGSMQVSDTKSL